MKIICKIILYLLDHNLRWEEEKAWMDDYDKIDGTISKGYYYPRVYIFFKDEGREKGIISDACAFESRRRVLKYVIIHWYFKLLQAREKELLKNK